jgi:RimJ/RimL family protein N-acetyltransferase
VLAQRLLRQLLDWAATKRVANVYLGTTAKFLAAHRIYEKNGFAEIAKAELPESFPIMAVDTKFYWLSPRPVAVQEKPVTPGPLTRSSNL